MKNSSDSYDLELNPILEAKGNTTIRDLKFKLAKSEHLAEELQQQLKKEKEKRSGEKLKKLDEDIWDENKFSNENTLRLEIKSAQNKHRELQIKYNSLLQTTESLKNEKKQLTSKTQHIEQAFNPKLDDFMQLRRKIEMLERNSEDREAEVSRVLSKTNAANNYEVDILKKQHTLQKKQWQKSVKEKNTEINQFRIELETILNEMNALKQYQNQNKNK